MKCSTGRHTIILTLSYFKSDVLNFKVFFFPHLRTPITFKTGKSASSIKESLNALCTGWRWSHVTGIHFFHPDSGMNPRLSNKLPVDPSTSPTRKFKELGQIFEARWNLLLSLSSFTGSTGLIVHYFTLGWRISGLLWHEIWHRDRCMMERIPIIFRFLDISSKFSFIKYDKQQSPLQFIFLDLHLEFDLYPNVMCSSLSILPSSHQVLKSWNPSSNSLQTDQPRVVDEKCSVIWERPIS